MVAQQIAERKAEGTTSCVHYWLIETPNGPVSNGTCRNCGDQRQFENHLMTSGFDKDDWIFQA